MKISLKQIKWFVFHMAKELGYTGEENLERLKQFISDEYKVIWVVDPKQFRQYKAKYGATFKPNPKYSTTYGIYTSKNNEWYLIETVLFRIKSGDWKIEEDIENN